MGRIIQYSDLQMFTQTEGLFGHVFPGALADTDKARFALHHKVYLKGPRTFFVLWDHYGCRGSSSAAQINTHYGYIGRGWKRIPSPNPELQKAVIFHIPLPCGIDDDTLVGEGRKCPYHKTDGRANVCSVDQESNGQQGHQGGNEFKGILFVSVCTGDLHGD